MRLIRSMGVGVFLVALVGCGGDALPTVRGQVTFKGEPVATGVIAFAPEGGAGPSTGAPIKNGQYVLDGKAKVPPGKYVVRIRATKATGKQVSAAPAEGMVDEVVQFLPPKYNDKTELKVEIGDSKEVALNFDLKP